MSDKPVTIKVVRKGHPAEYVLIEEKDKLPTDKLYKDIKEVVAEAKAEAAAKVISKPVK